MEKVVAVESTPKQYRARWVMQRCVKTRKEAESWCQKYRLNAGVNALLTKAFNPDGADCWLVWCDVSEKGSEILAQPHSKGGAK